MYLSNHQIPGSKIYDNEGHFLARVKRVLIDFNNGQILALETDLKGPNFISPQDIVLWKRHFLTLGQHYELLTPTDLIRVEQLLRHRHPLLLKKKVFTESGLFLGRVIDFSLHVEQFMLASITVQKTIFLWQKSTHLIHQSQIVQIKPLEIIVRDTLKKIPAHQKSLEKFGIQNSPTLDQA